MNEDAAERPSTLCALPLPAIVVTAHSVPNKGVGDGDGDGDGDDCTMHEMKRTLPAVPEPVVPRTSEKEFGTRAALGAPT